MKDYPLDHLVQVQLDRCTIEGEIEQVTALFLKESQNGVVTYRSIEPYEIEEDIHLPYDPTDCLAPFIAFLEGESMLDFDFFSLLELRENKVSEIRLLAYLDYINSETYQEEKEWYQYTKRQLPI